MSDDDQVIGAPAGGCWYCGKRAPVDDLVFCGEFDTNVHIQCAIRAHRKRPNDETLIIYDDVVPRDMREPKSIDQPLGDANGHSRAP